MSRLLYTVNIPRFFVSHRLPLALAARDAGYEVHVATAGADAENIAAIRAAGLPFHPLPLSQHGTNPYGEWATLRALLRLYRELQPALVHHVSIKPVIYGGLAARWARVPAVVAAMSGLGYVFIGADARARVLRQIVKPLFRAALATPNTHMIFQNPDDRQQFIQLGVIQPERTALIRGSGVDMTRFVPTPEPDGLPVVMFAGRLMWRKGIGAFVEVARRLHGRARFVVVGYAEATSPDTVAETQLRQWVEAGWIEWWGQRDDMPQVLAAAHLVCLPSTYGEGVPKVLIEAAACARPIVTTDTPGCREIAQDGENGLLVPPDDLPALTAAVAQLIGDKALRQRMGQAGHRRARDAFSLEHVVSATLALYERIAPSPDSLL